MLFVWQFIYQWLLMLSMITSQCSNWLSFMLLSAVNKNVLLMGCSLVLSSLSSRSGIHVYFRFCKFEFKSPARIKVSVDLEISLFCRNYSKFE